ncbi:MAG: hypothetical protein LBQ10_12140 [Desulfovibrio sp.]|jgi:hypothetical protein|nr:hypothetical protein [Desulfovibrio sp.]
MDIGFSVIYNGIKDAISLTKDANSLPVLRERMALVQDQLRVAEKKYSELEAENSDLLRENRILRKEKIELEDRLNKLDASPLFVDIGPCFIKKEKSGRILDGFYCPKCRTILEFDTFWTGEHSEGRYYCRCGFSHPYDVIMKAMKNCTTENFS